MKTDLMIVREEDRIAVAGILVKNGYTVTQIKRKRTPTGKTVEYGLRVERQEVSHADDR